MWWWKVQLIIPPEGTQQRHTNWKMDWQDVGISCWWKFMRGKANECSLPFVFVFRDPLTMQLCSIMPVYRSPDNSSAWTHRHRHSFRILISLLCERSWKKKSPVVFGMRFSGKLISNLKHRATCCQRNFAHPKDFF